MHLLDQLITLFLCMALVRGYIEEPGPRYPPTKGEIWPKPYHQIKTDSFFILRNKIFDIKVISNPECSLIRNAVVNYEIIVSKELASVERNLNLSKNRLQKKPWLKDNNYLGYFDRLEVILDGPCNGSDYPSGDMSEAYNITISENNKLLTSKSMWGILRGLESFSQMVYIADDGLSLRLNKTYVEDHPRFSHRGLLLDTSRHFIPVKSILLTLDAMSYNKLNVFHWHIVDDQSFPYVSKKFPELSEKGAYISRQTYSTAEIQTIIEYARLRGIRVIPEFDTPGHTRSWGVAHPELLTSCEGELAGSYGPIDPSKKGTYDFMKGLLEEVAETFPDKYIHLGGDEVDFDCWESNANIKKFMKENGIEKNYTALESLYMQKIIDIVENLNSKSIVWEEVFTNGVQLNNQTIIHVWKGLWEDVLDQVTSSGKKSILSACWYLDHLDSDGDWEKYYFCEPFTFSDDPAKQSRVIGGEACMWSEVVNEFNVISRVWPRASAVAERLWSKRDDNVDTDEVKKRLEEHTCRMNRRGIAAQPPNGPGFCY